MGRFLHHADIRHYRELLEKEQDEEKRNIIRKMLAEEEAKDAPAKSGSQQDKSKHTWSQAASVGGLFRLQRSRQISHFALIAINGRVDLQTLALDDIFFPTHQFGKRYSLVAANTTARMEVIQQVKALANI